MTQCNNVSDFRLVHLLAGLCGHFDKPYCYPSQDKLRELLGRIYGRRMSPRTLNRHLKALEQQGYFRRVHRHRRDPQLGWTFRSTLYVLTRRTYAAMKGLAVTVWRATRQRWTSPSSTARLPSAADNRSTTHDHTPGAASTGPPGR